jgi:large subunit ribosomal protein L29
LKIEEICVLSDKELAEKIETMRRELMDLRFKLATRQLTNHRELVKAKKDIARLLTVKSERELGITRAKE